MLANVRNGEGFAGCDTGDGYISLSDGRGLPVDLSPELRKIVDKLSDDEIWETDDEALNYWLGDHSFTWLAYTELQDPAYWAHTTRERGWVDPWNFELWRQNGKPGMWSGGVDGAHIEHVANQFLAHIIDSGDLQWAGESPPEGSWDERAYTTSFDREDEDEQTLKEGQVEAAIDKAYVRYVTQVEWRVTYKDEAEHFLKQLDETLALLGNPDPKNIRLVMGFDS